MSEPRQIGGLDSEFTALIQGLAVSWATCACGNRFTGHAGESCYGCMQAEIRRGEAGPQIRTHVPARFRGRGFGEYQCPPGDANAQGIVEGWNGARGLYLWSQGKGAGKSHLAFALIQARAGEGKIGALEWSEYLDTRKASMRQSNGELEDKLRAMRHADLALIDDVGTGQVTDWAVAELWSLVNARYLAAKPTLITSNYGMGQLAGRLALAGDREMADRIVSRLREMCLELEVKAQDFRVHGASK